MIYYKQFVTINSYSAELVSLKKQLLNDAKRLFDSAQSALPTYKLCYI